MKQPKVRVRKITDISLIREAISFCYGIESEMDLALAYKRFHTPVRLQLFAVFMQNIPNKVSVHLVRHSAVGEFHLVGSNRADWNGAHTELDKYEHDIRINRLTPVNHFMMLNAQHLTDISHARLCHDAEISTRRIWKLVKDGVEKVDPELAKRMVPSCIYRGGICESANCCGLNKTYKAE